MNYPGNRNVVLA